MAFQVKYDGKEDWHYLLNETVEIRFRKEFDRTQVRTAMDYLKGHPMVEFRCDGASYRTRPLPPLKPDPTVYEHTHFPCPSCGEFWTCLSGVCFDEHTVDDGQLCGDCRKRIQEVA